MPPEQSEQLCNRPWQCTIVQCVHHPVIFDQKFELLSLVHQFFGFSTLQLQSVFKLETSVKRMPFRHQWGNSDWIAGCVKPGPHLYANAMWMRTRYVEMREMLMWMCSAGSANCIRLCGERWAAKCYLFGVGPSKENTFEMLGISRYV